MEVKLLPDGDKLEARFKGNNLTPGYWRNPEATVKAFDEEGFYKTGDALKFIDEKDPNAGMLFDGRIAEDFKLSSGTWVSVGVLRAKLIAQGDGVVRDAVITGHDKDYPGAILIPDVNRCKELISDAKVDALELTEIMKRQELKDFLQNFLNSLAKTATGSSTKVKRAVFADFELSIDKGEITDKGSINQRSFLKHRSAIVERIYEDKLHPGILEIKN
ncbi:AMP-binding protein [Maribacter litopenaei]|uniref:AMP-binding protein n=1 Tax=Maribacter litopenaei TaxID=2976127 RepID=A0ABY5Y601_9FLAO|nr:AMP-binding protein [Maribacter litopenaei]UWX53910.1 AMP-binding protein [Maribacter litopenaei]